MTIRSMTGFAQVKGQIHAQLGFSLSLKSVNHRFLDVHFRLPSGTDSLEMQLRKLLKQRIARGHVDVSLSLERAAADGFALNRTLVAGYVAAFRDAATEFKIAAEPDLNSILRMPGAIEAAADAPAEEVEKAVLAKVEEALDRLDQMRAEEGGGIATELRGRMQQLQEASLDVERHRRSVLQNYRDRLQSRMQELLGSGPEPERLMQEAALLADRSDIQEEIARLQAHIKQFLALLDGGGELGKKLDFLLQEMNREANTLLSKTSGLAGEALRITECGLAMKAEIEKSREQVQNLE
jgi:uncharacterized protein (TIGR00255 family)